MPEFSEPPAWVRYAEDFGAPMKTLREATERTGVGAEAFLAVAGDVRAIRALLGLALRINTIGGYSVCHPPQDVGGGVVVQDEEMVISGKIRPGAQ